MPSHQDKQCHSNAAKLDFIQLQLLDRLSLSSPQMKLAATSLKGAIRNGLSSQERQVQLQRLLEAYEAELKAALFTIKAMKAVQDQKDDK